MAKFKVGDKVICTGPHGYDGSIVVGGRYEVHTNAFGRLVVTGSGGGEWWVECGSYCFKPVPEETPAEDDKALAWIKARITHRGVQNSGDGPWNQGYGTALREILKDVYGLTVGVQFVQNS